MRDLNDIPRLNKLHGMAFAVVRNDTGALDGLLKEPIESFKKGHQYDKFRTKGLQSDIEYIARTQIGNVNSGLRPESLAHSQAGHPGHSQHSTANAQGSLESAPVIIDLTDSDPPEAKTVIDLTDN